MMRLKLSCALLLVVLGLSPETLNASGEPSPKPIRSKFPSPPVRIQQEPQRQIQTQKASSDKSLPRESSRQPQPKSQQDRAAGYPEWTSHWLWKEVNWSGVGQILVTAIGLWIIWLTLRSIQSQAKATKDAATAALRQAESITTSERAYVKMSHLPPGLIFGPEARAYWIAIRIENFGRTPARITATVIKTQYFPPGESPPSLPDYSRGVEQLGGAFMVPHDNVGQTISGMFGSSRIEEAVIEEAVRAGRGRWLVFGYVDYIDKFGKRHRAGYAREYNKELDDPSRYSAEDYPKRSNLSFVVEPDYNYDRERQRGEGEDWDVPV